MSCTARQTGKAYASPPSWPALSRCTSLLLFDNLHLLLLLCAVQMTKWGNGLWKMIINAAGRLTRKGAFSPLSSSRGTSIPAPRDSLCSSLNTCRSVTVSKELMFFFFFFPFLHFRFYFIHILFRFLIVLMFYILLKEIY